ncbi:hypothetical protein DTO013E5_2969 [Penicillium roqueforti]|nr:hypothetical protein LCP963914a_5288 [Penicillium roqueforti]KAI2701106.1 hypothetical protein CBS147372_5176 [Penicillium roqueforti]KAI2739108.1 hypothetical protein DTO012A1_6373 [Penicillium roqueforti]KAI2771924.1 hypothetical protein DTO012A8_3429 [Penicillium roqueforti]KAI3082560.1 hypothetical protein CBS147339_2440 [Penicillium roqueforti]
MLVTYQQLDGYQMPYDNLGLSDACFDAVNTTVTSCPAWVGYIGVESASFDIVPSEQLVALCESGSIAYPTTFMTDRYLYSTGLSCLTDP